MFVKMFRGVAASLLLLSCTLSSGVIARPTNPVSVSEEVRYPSDPGVVLAGTLEKPATADDRPVPVVVIISGTGPWTRGGWVAMRARLQAAGIATLMYDKRGQGRSTGTFVDTIPAMQRDVAAAVSFLRTRPDIDHRCIALMGISQGAVAAPLVASKDPGIAAVIMLSGPVGPRGELFLGILRGHLQRAGKDPEQVARVTKAVAAWMDARSQRADRGNVGRLRQSAAGAFVQAGFPQKQAEDFVNTLDNDVVLSMFDVAPDRALEMLRMPTLAVYGSKDEVIAPFASIAAATASLEQNPDAIVIAVPDMTHELRRASPSTNAAVAPEDGTMPALIEVVGNWIAARLARSPPAR